MLKKISLMFGMIFLFIVGLVSVIAADPVVYGDKLQVSDLDVKVTDAMDGSTKTAKDLVEGDEVSKDINPGDNVEFKVEITNLYDGLTEETDLEIEDVEVTVTIIGIDEDDEDLDEEGKEFDVKSTKDKDIRVNFDIPLEVDEASYDVEIVAVGREKDGTRLKHKVVMNVALDIEKESHDLRIFRNTVSPSSTICKRKGLQLNVGVLNAGSDEEEDVILTTSNDDLEIDFRETFTITDGTFDDDIKYTKNYRFDVPEDLEAGNYPILVRVEYDNGDEFREELIDFLVEECTLTTTTTVPDEPDVPQDPVDNTVVDVILPPLTTGGAVVDPTTTTVPHSDDHDEPVEQGGLFSNNAFVALLIGGEILVALLVIFLIVGLTRRR
tara:strand:- start:21305 stop:22450 length:1146 start_codon:yes stop_codon:yes gene_type:complete